MESWSRSRCSLARRLLAVALGLVVASTACGGDDDSSSATTESVTPTPRDATAIVVPTSTPLPTPTPLPTSTPVPLDAPTPSSVLLTTAFTNDSKVTTVGIDEVFFGMTAEEAAEAASTEWVTDGAVSTSCYLVTPANGPEGVTLWVVDGRVERVDIEHREIRTPSHLGIDNTLAELTSQLGGRLTSEERDDGTVIATFTPSDPGDREFRVVFELVDDRVVRYRSGRIGTIERPVADC